jgi:hypothetical protein
MVPEWVPNAALADRNAFVQAGEVERVVDPQFGEQRLVGQLLDLEHDAVEMAANRAGRPASAMRAQSPRSRRASGDDRSGAACATA